jgi:hypothetical protein
MRHFFFPPPAVQQPNLGPSCLIAEVSRSHTVRSTPGKTPRNKRLARDSGYYLYNTKTNIHTLSWIRTHDARNQAASDLHLRYITLTYVYFHEAPLHVSAYTYIYICLHMLNLRQMHSSLSPMREPHILSEIINYEMNSKDAV